ncbi:MAG: hypothetical protein ACT4OS_10885 [Acidimicrobiales bacterium]
MPAGTDPEEAAGAPGAAPTGPRSSVLGLLLKGWPAALAAALVAMVVAVALSAIVGVGLTLAATKDPDLLADAAIGSVPLALAAFGSRVAVAANEAATNGLTARVEGPLLVLLILGAWSASSALSLVAGKWQGRPPAELVALVVKFAVLTGAVAAGMAYGLAQAWDQLGFVVLAPPAEAALVGAAWAAAAGLWWLARSRLIRLPLAEAQKAGLRQALRAAATGARTAGMALALMVPAVVLAALEINPALETDQLPGAVVALIVVLPTMAVMALSVAMGGTISLPNDQFGEGTLSLSAFSLPPAPGAEAADLAFRVVMLVVPGLIGFRTYRALRRERTKSSGESLATAAGLVGGFLAAMAVLAILCRQVLLTGSAGGSQTSLAASLNVAVTVGLAAAAGVVGGLVPALLRRTGWSAPASAEDQSKFEPETPPAAVGASRYSRSK